MKPRKEIIWVATLLLGVAALSAINRGARSSCGDTNGGACCAILAAPDAMAMRVYTNGTPMITNTPDSTNRF